MRKGFFARLAVVNIRKNKQIYVPYILACLFSHQRTNNFAVLVSDDTAASLTKCLVDNR